MPTSAIFRILGLLALTSVPIASAAAQAEPDAADRDAFVAWAARAARPLAPLDGPDSAVAVPALSSLSTFTRATRVVALGESVHDAHEFIVLRTRLTEQLIRSGRVAAVVMETGLAEARAVDAWISHETDSAPDFARALSYGWGRQAETVEALRRLRDHNARLPAARRVRFHGMDLPANGGGSLLPALEPVWSFLDAADPGFAAESRAALGPIATRIAGQGYGIVGKYAALGPARDSLRRALDTLGARMRAHERAYVARTSRGRYDWARRLAAVAAQTEAAVRIGWNDASNPRDVAMAENVEWILAREGARGLVVLWSHDLHVARAPIGGPMFAGRKGAPFVTSMGERLARSLGPAYLPVGTAFRRSARDSAGVLVDSTSVDAALARVGVPLYLLDLRRAPRGGGVARWLDAEHLTRAEGGYVVTAPGRAYDAMIYVDSIGAARAEARDSPAQPWSARTPLPPPTGAHAVGTDVLHIVDSSRATSRSIRTRPITVQRWYPARRGTGAPASYIAERSLLDSMMRAGYLDLRPDEMSGWRDVRLAARVGARAATSPDARGWPVVVLSHGLGAARAHYSALAQELASHGYVVLAIDHPIGGFTLAPNGRVLRPGVDSLHYPASPLAFVVRDWAIDDVLVVRRAAALGSRGSPDVGAVVIDTTRVAAIGHSLGGAAALQACLSQPLFDACADMDGDVFGDVETSGIGKPILVLLSQPDHRGRPPARDSADSARRQAFARMGRERDSTWSAICARQRGAPCFVVKLVGTAHFSFSDAPFQMPRQLRDVGATLTPAEMHRAMTARLLDFLDHELRGRPLRVLEPGMKTYP